MLETLKLVRGAVAEKDLVPVLTHFHISDGHIQGGNGRVAIDAVLTDPVLKKINVTVPGAKFLMAVDGCKGEPTFKKTDVNLIVKRGTFRVVLPLADHDSFPITEPPHGKRLTLKVGNDLLPTLRRLRPFIGTDASRAWLCSVLIKDGYAYASNNPIVARVPCDLPDMVLPVYTIDELMRIGIPPIAIWLSPKGNMYFDLNHKRWVYSTTLAGEWPDVEKFFDPVVIEEIASDELREAVQRVIPFCPDAKFPELFFSDKGVSTADGTMSAAVECASLPEGRWHAKNMLLILSEATHMNLDAWPDVCRWTDVGIDGVAVGCSKELGACNES